MQLLLVIYLTAEVKHGNYPNKSELQIAYITPYFTWIWKSWQNLRYSFHVATAPWSTLWCHCTSCQLLSFVIWFVAYLCGCMIVFNTNWQQISFNCHSHCQTCPSSHKSEGFTESTNGVSANRQRPTILLARCDNSCLSMLFYRV